MLSNIRAGKATIYGDVNRAETSLCFYIIASIGLVEKIL
jgi:hypothetical protein